MTIPVHLVTNLTLPLLTQFRNLFRHHHYRCIRFDPNSGHLQCCYYKKTRSTCFIGKQDLQTRYKAASSTKNKTKTRANLLDALSMRCLSEVVVWFNERTDCFLKGRKQRRRNDFQRGGALSLRSEVSSGKNSKTRYFMKKLEQYPPNLPPGFDATAKN